LYGCHHRCAVSRSYPIYFTSTFYSIFSSTAEEPLYRSDANLYTYETGIHPEAALQNRIFVAFGGRKISEYLERFRLSSTKYPRIFRRDLWIFRSCYWHIRRWNLFTTSLMATLSYVS